MSLTDLANGLKLMIPTSSEATARQRIVDAYIDMVDTATASLRPIQVNQHFIDAAEEMLQGLVGISDPNQAAISIETGVTAFWLKLATNPPLVFQSAVAITIPGLSFDMTTPLNNQFIINRNGSIDLNSSAASIAAIIYADAIAGGTVTFSDLPGTFPII